MIPDIYKKVYAEETEQKRISSEKKDDLTDIVDRHINLPSKAVGIYHTVKATPLLSDGNDGEWVIPLESLNTDGTIKNAVPYSSSALAYIMALCALGMREEANETFAFAKWQNLFDYGKRTFAEKVVNFRKEGIPSVWSGAGHICSDDVFRYISALSKLDEKRKAKKVMRQVLASEFFTLRNDGLPANWMTEESEYSLEKVTKKTPWTPMITYTQVSSISVFSYISSLCSLGEKANAIEVYKIAKEYGLFRDKDCLHPYKWMPEGEVLEGNTASHGEIYTYLDSLFCMGLYKKARQVYDTALDSRTLEFTSDGLPVTEFIEDNGICKAVFSADACQYITAIMAMHQINNTIGNAVR